MVSQPAEQMSFVLRFSGERRQARGEREAQIMREEGGAQKKMTSVRTPLLKLFRQSDMNAATQLVTC